MASGMARFLFSKIGDVVSPNVTDNRSFHERVFMQWPLPEKVMRFLE